MAVLNSKFDILKGWPNGGAVSLEVQTIGTNANWPQTAGTWITLDEASLATLKVKGAGATSAGETLVGLVIEGKEEQAEGLSNTCTVLFGGGYVVRLENKAADEMFDDDNDLVPGAAVKVVNGILVKAPAVGEAIGYVIRADRANDIGTIDVLVTAAVGIA